MQTGIKRIATKARENKKLQFTSLAHHITPERLGRNLKLIPKSTSVVIDKQDVESAEKTFAQWSQEILGAMHRGGYKPPATRRVYIPKPGKTNARRAIAVPTVVDRVLQKSTADVLNAIYEQDFLDCSYGGRANRSAHQAIAKLHRVISSRKVNYILEADLENFFGSLNHGWVERFLEHRVKDPRIANLVRKWLRAGVMEDGQHRRSTEGVAQGGPISVLISNIYLHYVLDLWIEKQVKPRMRGEIYYIRYLDDFVLCFQYASDAACFRQVLTKRLNKFTLKLKPEKTRLIKFGRYAGSGPKQQKQATLHFLGLTFYHSKNRHGRFKVGMKTEKSRYRRSCANMKALLLSNRHKPVREQVKLINQRLRGHFQYYGIAGNSESISNYHYFTKKYWRKALSSRSQNGKVSWDKFNHIQTLFPLCRPKIHLPYGRLPELAGL